MGQAAGGPLDKDGMVGKHFTEEGVIGGTAQSMMGGKKTTWIPLLFASFYLYIQSLIAENEKGYHTLEIR